MTAILIRRATPEDASAARPIPPASPAAYGLPLEPARRPAAVATSGLPADERDDLVAELDGTVVGLASVGPQGALGVAWVSKVFVASHARRRGAGRLLLEAAHTFARARDYVEIGLRTRTLFLEAIALYESSGYVRRGAPHQGDVVYFRRL